MYNTMRSTAAVLAILSVTGPALALDGTLYKDPNCPCCEGHVEYLRQKGIGLEVKPVENLVQMSLAAGIPAAYHGCHLIKLDGYVIEGHVSFDIIQKLLKDRPAGIVGIALPGMPTGVPGMSGPKDGMYEVYAIGKDGSAVVFATQ